MRKSSHRLVTIGGAPRAREATRLPVPPRPKIQYGEAPPDPWASDGLAEVGLVRGDLARFRPHAGGRWREAVVERRERDGSVGVRDGNGAARAIPLASLEVRRRGPRGGLVWLPADELAEEPEQRRLL